MKQREKDNRASVIKAISMVAIVAGIIVKGISNAWVLILAVLAITACIDKPLYAVFAIVAGVIMAIVARFAGVKKPEKQKEKTPETGAEE